MDAIAPIPAMSVPLVRAGSGVPGVPAAVAFEAILDGTSAAAEATLGEVEGGEEGDLDTEAPTSDDAEQMPLPALVAATMPQPQSAVEFAAPAQTASLTEVAQLVGKSTPLNPTEPWAEGAEAAQALRISDARPSDTAMLSPSDARAVQPERDAVEAVMLDKPPEKPTEGVGERSNLGPADAATNPKRSPRHSAPRATEAAAAATQAAPSLLGSAVEADPFIFDDRIADLAGARSDTDSGIFRQPPSSFAKAPMTAPTEAFPLDERRIERPQRPSIASAKGAEIALPAEADSVIEPPSPAVAQPVATQTIATIVLAPPGTLPLIKPRISSEPAEPDMTVPARASAGASPVRAEVHRPVEAAPRISTIPNSSVPTDTPELPSALRLPAESVDMRARPSPATHDVAQDADTGALPFGLPPGPEASMLPVPTRHALPPSRGGDIPASLVAPDADVQSRDGATHLRLDPEELGRLDIKVERTDAGVSIIVRAERGESADLMRRNAELLHRELADGGIVGARLDFGQAGGQAGGQGGRHLGQPGSQHPGPAGFPADRPSSDSGGAPPPRRAPNPTGGRHVDMRF